MQRLENRLEAAERQLKSCATDRFLQADILDHADALISVVDPAGRVLLWNATAERMTGYGRGQALSGRTLCRRLFPDRSTRSQIQRLYRRIAEADRSMNGLELDVVCADGQHKILSWTVRRLHRRGDDRSLFVITANDVTRNRQSRLQMEQLAFYDTLTELPNRRLFRNRLEQALDAAQRKRSRVAVMFLDLDRFKRINDSLGHELGDALLRAVARRLRTCVRRQDTVARLGGDEFTVMLPELDDPATASVVAGKILDALQRPILLSGRDLFVTGSIGISVAPDDAHLIPNLLRNADLAMYRAKERGRNNFQYFTDELNQRVSRQLTLEIELRTALDQGQFLLHFQPIYQTDGKHICGLECLLRWNHPRRGLVFPEEFIGALEETGMIVDLGEWILRRACERVQHIGQGNLPIAVNLSARQFREEGLQRTVQDVLRDTGLPPRQLRFEITETMIMDDIDRTLDTLMALKQLGVGLSIDDFGVGHSSLNYLKRFPVDALKVDRSFVRNIPDDRHDMEITAAVIAMAHQLTLKVVAEGVETREQLEFLAGRQCDQVQGYYCGIPTDEDGLDYLLKING